VRQRIIEALTYPRMLMTGHLDEEGCPLNLYFDQDHESCRYCDKGDQCHWLNRNDEFSMLNPALGCAMHVISCVSARARHLVSDASRPVTPGNKLLHKDDCALCTSVRTLVSHSKEAHSWLRKFRK
jgi:hypothetical protein